MEKKSLRQLAKELGVSPSYLSQVKNGKRPPSKKLLSKSETIYDGLQLRPVSFSQVIKRCRYRLISNLMFLYYRIKESRAD
ncbi:MAG: helix-turn-helix transcriptional regulator [Dehalococcoidales bacterium]|nr:MAG: helix-turn-helix transcriptional regulator [Dehalococcoidales bacterium]